MIQESGDRRLADRHLFLRQPGLEFRQRNVRLLYHQFPDQSLMRHQRELLVAAKLGGADATCVAVNFEEAHHRADAHPTLLGGLGYGIATINRRDHAPTQVLRIRLRPPRWPPPSRKLESYSCRYGNPRFSLFGKRSKIAPEVCRLCPVCAPAAAKPKYRPPILNHEVRGLWFSRATHPAALASQWLTNC